MKGESSTGSQPSSVTMETGETLTFFVIDSFIDDVKDSGVEQKCRDKCDVIHG